MSVERVDALPVDPICGAKGRVFRRAGVKYSVSFLFSFDGQSSLSVKTIVNDSSSQSGPGISATNSTELSAELESFGDDSRSLKSIVKPLAEGSERCLRRRLWLFI